MTTVGIQSYWDQVPFILSGQSKEGVGYGLVAFNVSERKLGRSAWKGTSEFSFCIALSK